MMIRMMMKKNYDDDNDDVFSQKYIFFVIF